MPNNKHLTLDNRITIESMLNTQSSFKEIAALLNKDPSTISKEVRSHLVFRHVGAMRTPYNSCALRFQCKKSHLCTVCHAVRKYSLCKRCNMCNAFCKDFQKEICSKLLNGEEDFASCPNISIDYGIMEKAENVYVQLCDFGWADLGTWGSLHDASPKDMNHNVIIKGHTLLYDCKNNIVALPEGKLAVLQGLDDYLVADTDNVLLVCRKDDENTIRRYVNDTQVKLGDEFV